MAQDEASAASRCFLNVCGCTPVMLRLVSAQIVEEVMTELWKSNALFFKTG